MTDDRACPNREPGVPRLTACRLCAGETLGSADTLDGGQLTRLRELEHSGLARLTLSDCLDECERGDVVVVHPSRLGTPLAARPLWFARLAGDQLTEALAEWLTADSLNRRDLPEPLLALEIRRAARDSG